MKFFRTKAPRGSNEELNGRYQVIKELIEKSRKTLDIGCKYSRLGDVNLDIDYTSKPNIVADVLKLPIKNDSFEKVIFSEVVEHLPQGTEEKVINEIARVLQKGGELILTTPNDYWFYTLTDPAFILKSHRHYKKNEIIRLVKKNDFKIKRTFIRGGVWCFLFMTWYYVLTYTFDIKVPKFLMEKEKKDYFVDNEKGVTIFLIAERL